MAKDTVTFRLKPPQFGGPGTYKTKINDQTIQFTQKNAYTATVKDFERLNQTGFFETFYVPDAVGTVIGEAKKKADDDAKNAEVEAQKADDDAKKTAPGGAQQTKQSPQA